MRQALAGSVMFTLLVTSVLTGLLPATGVLALGGSAALAIVLGVVVAVGFALAVALLEGRRVRRVLQRWTPMRPTTAG